MSATGHLASAPTVYEPCEECGAPLDPQQRYCVHCAARRGNGANPSSRYFAALSKRARRPAVVRPPARTAPGGRAAAVGFFALLPIAVAIGVVVGRAGSGNGDEGALLQALRERGPAAVAGVTPGGSATAQAKGKAAKAKQGQGQKTTGKPREKVAAKTHNGTVHQVTGYTPSQKKVEETTKMVEENVDQTGSGYIESQQNLPDVIPVGGNPDEAPPLPTGKGE